MIRVDELRVELPDGAVLLPNTTLTATAGRIVAVRGASGSGKTTLLRAMIGYLPPTAVVGSGGVEVAGVDPFAASDDQLRSLRRQHVAFVGQDPGSALNPWMSVRRIVAETAHDRHPDAISAVLRRCHVPTDGGFPRRRPGAISGGQQRRVALARALARKPQVLLLDEPTAGLDAGLRTDIATLLRSVADEGAVVLISCHDDAFVAEYADDIVDLSSRASRLRRVEVAPRKSPPTGEGSLAAQDVTVTFRTRGSQQLRVLSGTSFEVPAGSMIGLTGDSGSGKSTLLRTLAGLQRTEAGAVSLDGAPLAPKRTATQRRRVQYISQNPLGALNPARTAGQSIRRPLRLHRIVSKDREQERVIELLAQVGLEPEHAARYPDALSGGQRQRVSLARALALEPDYLLCDEITSALDTQTAAGIVELLEHIRTGSGTAIVLVSHDEQLLATSVERVFTLIDGRLTDRLPVRDQD